MFRSLLAVLGLVLGLWSAPLVLAQNTMPSPHGAIHYQYSGEGEGPAVVLVHGFSVPMWVWQPLYESLASSGRRVLRFDLYGRGGSERAAEDSLEIFHDEINTLLDGLAIGEPVDIVGLSMGGAITASYAADYSPRVRRVVLVSPFNTPVRIPLLNRDGVGEWLARHILAPIAQRWGYRRSFADADQYLAAHPDVLEHFASHDRSEDYALALLSSMRNIVFHDQLERYAQLDTRAHKTLLIWGEDDKVTPFEQAGRIRQALGNAEFLAVPEAGHLPHLEREDLVVPKIVQFLDNGSL